MARHSRAKGNFRRENERIAGAPRRKEKEMVRHRRTKARGKEWRSASAQRFYREEHHGASNWIDH